jgi:CBS-domain-containing membrane protein
LQGYAKAQGNNLWYHLKRKAIKDHPELERIAGSQADLDALVAACQEAWLALLEESLEKLLNSMERRL